MSRKHFFICLSLFISLFIYLFYRTDRTLVNQIVIKMISLETYTWLKANIKALLPLNSIIIYSLPEGLWIFCITLTTKPYYIKLGKWRFDCIYIPLLFCITLEIFQLFHITNGRFDFMDIGISVLFWIIARYFLRDDHKRQDIFGRPGSKMLVCLGSYCIVYLAHVFK